MQFSKAKTAQFLKTSYRDVTFSSRHMPEAIFIHKSDIVSLTKYNFFLVLTLCVFSFMRLILKR